MPCECPDPDWCVTCLRKRLLTPRKVVFADIADRDEAERTWEVSVDGETVCEVDEDELSPSNAAMKPLWTELNVEVTFVD